MQILGAETGKRFLLDQEVVEKLDSIDALRKLVESVTGVPESTQILMLPDGAQIKSSTFRYVVNGGGNSEPVLFLFNRQLLDEELPDLSSILEPIILEPPYEASSSSLLLDRNASITDQCTGYLSLFRSHLAQIEAYMQSTSAHIQSMNRLIQEQQVQAMALNVALANLDAHTQSVVNPWLEFNSYVHKQIARHSVLLLSFPTDMRILSSIRVHPAIIQSLKSEDGGNTAEEDGELVEASGAGAVMRRKRAGVTSNSPSATLAEFVPMEKLERWAAGCREAHDVLVNTVKELAATIANIQSGTDEERGQGLCVDFTSLENLLRDSLECERKLEAKRVVFERDLSRIHEIIAEISGSTSQAHKNTSSASPPSSLPRDPSHFPSPTVSSFPQGQQDSQTNKSPPHSPSRTRDKLIAIEHLAQIHREDYIPEAMALEGFVREAVGKVADDKVQLVRQLLRQLLQVSRLSSSIATVPPMFTNLESMLQNQIRVFAQLQHVHRMPIAYGASMVEIVRRKEYKSILLQKAQDLAEGLSRFRLQELKRRDNFRVEIRDYVPFAIPGMDDQPPFCELSATNTREILPNITREHLTEFESQIAALRTLLIDAAPGGSQSNPGIPGTSLDGITKLQAAMKRMLTQVDAMTGDFEKTVVKPLLPDRLLRLEEENSRLRQDLSTTSGQAEDRTFFATRAATPGSIIPTPHPSANSSDVAKFGASMRSQLEQAQETIRAYEIRFRSMEKHIQQIYNSERTTSDTTSSLPLRTTSTPPPVLGPLSRSSASPSTRSLSALGSPLGRGHKTIPKAASSSDIRHTPGGTKEEEELRRRCKELEFELEKLKLGKEAVRREEKGDESASSRDGVQAEIEQLRKQVDDKTEAWAQLLKENAKLVDEQSRLQKQYMESRQEAKASLEDLHENMDKAMHELKEVRAKRDEALNRISTLEEDLRNQLSLAKEEYTRSQDALKGTCDDNDKMHETIRTCSARLLDCVDSPEDGPPEEAVHFDQEKNVGKECERLRTVVEVVEQDILERKRISLQKDARAREQIVELEGSRKDFIEKQEEWEIVCRFACEQLHTYYKTLRNLATTLKLPLTPTALASSSNNPMEDSISGDFPSFFEYSDELGGDRKSSSDAIKVAYKQVATLSARLDVEAIVRAAVESVEAVEEKYQRKIKEGKGKISFYDFQISDWALFLPTRNPKAWAAFNIGSPHYFLRPTDKFSEQIRNREWIVAQIVHIEEHEVDNKDPSTNPFGLADKVKYYLIESVSWKRKRLSTTSIKTKAPTVPVASSLSTSPLTTNGILENSIPQQMPSERSVGKNTSRRTFNK